MFLFVFKHICVVYAFKIPHQVLEVSMPSFQHSFGSETMDSQWVYITSKGNTPTIPHGEPRFCMPKQRVRNGEWIKYPVEVLHESSPKVFKIVSVMQDEGLEVIIDRTCLFALDFMNGVCIGSPLRFHDGFCFWVAATGGHQMPMLRQNSRASGLGA